MDAPQSPGEAQEADPTPADASPQQATDDEAALARARSDYEAAWRGFQEVLRAGTPASQPDPGALAEAQDRVLRAGKTLKEAQKRARRGGR